MRGHPIDLVKKIVMEGMEEMGKMEKMGKMERMEGIVEGKAN